MQPHDIGLSLLSYSRLECLKIAQNNNHYAINRKLLIAVNQASYKAYLKMKNLKVHNSSHNMKTRVHRLRTALKLLQDNYVITGVKQLAKVY